MNISQHARLLAIRPLRQPMVVAVALSMVAALAYVLIAWGVLGVGDRQVVQDGSFIIYVAAACYLLGGVLILTGRRWLWLAGVVINALVILFFFRLYQARPAVVFSPGGLLSKAAQLLLEATLIYLIAADWLRAHRAAR